MFQLKWYNKCEIARPRNKFFFMAIKTTLILFFKNIQIIDLSTWIEVDSQGADVKNRPVQNSKTGCVTLTCFFNKSVSRAVWLSSLRVTRICCLVSKKCIDRIRQNLVRSFAIDCFMGAHDGFTKEDKKRAKNWAKPGKQHGCHNFYR